MGSYLFICHIYIADCRSRSVYLCLEFLSQTNVKIQKSKYYFFPAICWDQWFPEAARAMVLQGAEILFYPTAIGSEPQDDGLDSCEHWRRVMQGHAGANLVRYKLTVASY